MEFTNPFEVEGQWYKGNLHLHTTNSDGDLSPEEIAEIYKDNGYDFIFITDHNYLTKIERKYEDFLVIPGVEFSKDNYHLLGLNIKESFNVENMSAQNIIDRINNQGGIAILCHPYWSALTYMELLSLKNYSGIEIYNNTCEKAKGKGYSSVHWDEVLQTGRKIYGFAVDDAHHHYGEHREDDILGSFVMVKSKSLTPEDICDSIKKGAFYSSTGVLIRDLKIKDNKIEIEFSPSIDVDFIGYGSSGERFSGKGIEIEYAKYVIKGNEKYLRIEITDKNYKKAWTNPILL